MSNSKMIENSKARHVSTCEEALEETSTTSNLRATVLKRGYVLNDSNALKKKLKHESRSEPFNVGAEAKDGSNVVIEMKTSFFEYTKSNFINSLQQNPEINSVKNAVGAKVNSANSGEAFVIII